MPVTAIVFFSAALLLSGCKKNVSTDVGIVLPTKDEPRWVQDETRFLEALKGKANVEILFSQGDSGKEKQNVETLLTKGIKVLVICAQDGAGAAAAVEEAAKEGVQVIAYDRLITDTPAVSYYVTFDSISVGRTQANYLIAKAGNTKDNPLYLYAGASSDNNSFLFFEGAWKALQPKIADGTFVIANSSEALALKEKKDLTRAEQSKIISQITTNWDFNEAKKKAADNLTSANDKLKGTVFILAPNDGTARSIADEFAKDLDVKKYYITGQDAEKASVQYIINGKQSMTVFKDVRLLVDDAVTMASELLDGKKPATTGAYFNGEKQVPAKQTQVISVDADNVKAELIDSGYYPASDFEGLK